MIDDLHYYETYGMSKVQYENTYMKANALRMNDITLYDRDISGRLIYRGQRIIDHIQIKKEEKNLKLLLL